jgi:hypothetical protein
MGDAARCAQLVVTELLGAGVQEVVLSPGSRSAPLAYELFEADKIGLLRLHVRIDERTAGFLALGLAKASERPVAVVTTSGTAAANLHPAVLEAFHSRVPLVAMTADRPRAVRHAGGNQTTDQAGLFARHVRAETQIDDTPATPRSWRFELARVLTAATGSRTPRSSRSCTSSRAGLDRTPTSWPSGRRRWWSRVRCPRPRGLRPARSPSRPICRCWPSRSATRVVVRTRWARAGCCCGPVWVRRSSGW